MDTKIEVIKKEEITHTKAFSIGTKRIMECLKKYLIEEGTITKEEANKDGNLYFYANGKILGDLSLNFSSKTTEVKDVSDASKKSEDLTKEQNARKVFLERGLDELDLSVRVRNRLRAQGLKTLKEILTISGFRSPDIRNFGQKCFESLQETVEGQKVCFFMDIEKYIMTGEVVRRDAKQG